MAGPDVGVFLPSMAAPGKSLGDLAASARHLEDLGFESAWVVDQLIAGEGNPLIESSVALAVAAAVTSRIKLAFGVMTVPLRPVAWVAKSVTSLQYVSGDRLILGVGAGGDRHERSWIAAGVPRRERGRRTDAALRVLPDLIAGKPVRVSDDPDAAPVQIAPGSKVPPIVVGGGSDKAIERAVRFGDAWFLMPMPPADVVAAGERIASVAAAANRPTPALVASLMVAIDGDPTVPDTRGIEQMMTDPNGMYGAPAEMIDTMLLRGSPSQLAERLHGYGEAGASRVVITIAAGDWTRQTDLVADARALL